MNKDTSKTMVYTLLFLSILSFVLSLIFIQKYSKQEKLEAPLLEETIAGAIEKLRTPYSKGLSFYDSDIVFDSNFLSLMDDFMTQSEEFLDYIKTQNEAIESPENEQDKDKTDKDLEKDFKNPEKDQDEDMDKDGHKKPKERPEKRLNELEYRTAGNFIRFFDSAECFLEYGEKDALDFANDMLTPSEREAGIFFESMDIALNYYINTMLSEFEKEAIVTIDKEKIIISQIEKAQKIEEIIEID